MTEKTLKAGAIILSGSIPGNIALLYRGKQKDWSFPKGHVEQGEDSLHTMVREIKEETGLDVDILQSLPSLKYISSAGENVSTKMFLVESKNDSNLKPEFEMDHLEWISYAMVIKKLSYNNLKKYFEMVSPVIEKFIAIL